jgi:hypothetical protein
VKRIGGAPNGSHSTGRVSFSPRGRRTECGSRSWTAVASWLSAPTDPACTMCSASSRWHNPNNQRGRLGCV